MSSVSSASWVSGSSSSPFESAAGGLGVLALSVLSRVSALGLGVVNDDLVVSKCPGKWEGKREGPATGVVG